jgi:hypothetical protein
MATRSIVTSHPVLACDVCGRSLLRGEQPDYFLSGGQRRTVCELCVPRATHEGWLRETDQHALRPRPAPPRRGRSLLGRLRQSRWPSFERAGEDAELPVSLGSTRLAEGSEESLYDFFDRTPPERRPVPAAPHLAREDSAEPLARALEVFNEGEQPRRLAGVARSLGTPTVHVADAPDGGAATVTVAWELCWYRYEVGLDGEPAKLLAQGTELGELAPHERAGNAAIDERGLLSLLS